MQPHLVTLTGAASALIVASLTSADFLGITGSLVDPVAEGWTGGDDGYDADALDTYRIYATFDDSNGRVTAAGSFSPPILMTTTSTDGAFWNSAAVGENDLPPTAVALQLPGARDLQWDSWVTIGLTELSPTLRQNFYDQANGLTGDFTLSGTGWKLTDDFEQGNTVDNRVLLAQFTVAEGAGINGDNWGLYLYDDLASPNAGIFKYRSFRIPSKPVPCPADLDGDDFIGFGDLTTLLNAWGPCSDCPADLDGEGVVGVTDLTTLLAAWGSC